MDDIPNITEYVNTPSKVLRALRIGLWSVGATALGAVAVICGPAGVEFYGVQLAAEASLLDWRDFGLHRAQGRLAMELDAAKIGNSVHDGACDFDSSSLSPQVVCSWDVEFKMPFYRSIGSVPVKAVAMLDRDGYLK